MTRTVLIVAGGTGGHVYPGLAVAGALSDAGVQTCWLGTRRGLEARVVPAAGYVFETIPIAGLRRAGVARWLLAPLTLSVALGCAVAAIMRLRPQVVLGMGGFVSGPGGLAAVLCRRPLVIHEQNAIAGLTNRLLSRIASRVLEAFPGTFPASRGAIATGNPVRSDIAALAPPGDRLAVHEGARVLVFGGSRGARALNETVPAALAACGLGDLRVRHQCGADQLEATRANYLAQGLDAGVEVTPYIEDMAAAYADADLVIARAGALTIAEIAAAGVASILVPYPYAVDDHQRVNAEYLVRHQAALVIAEREMSSAALAARIGELLGNRPRLLDMARRARALAQAEATANVAQQCLDLVDA